MTSCGLKSAGLFYWVGATIGSSTTRVGVQSTNGLHRFVSATDCGVPIEAFCSWRTILYRHTSSLSELSRVAGNSNESSHIAKIATKFSQKGRLKEALHIVHLMNQQGVRPSIQIYSYLLQQCIRMKALMEGKQVHAYILKSGFQFNISLGNNLLNMYANCGSAIDARRLFDLMPQHNAFSWALIISAYAKQGQRDEAINLFQRMQREVVAYDKFVFVAVLKACASLAVLDWGKQVHAHIVKSPYESDIYVRNTLIDMYAKCGSMDDACKIFNKMHQRDVVSWNVLIAGYSQQGLGDEALALFERMHCEGMKPDNITFVSILKVCANLAILGWGKLVHAQVVNSGCRLDVFVGSTLVDMYVKCRRLKDACQVFSKMNERNVVSWNAMIAGYVQQGQGREALTLYEEMRREDIRPDNTTFVSILNACAGLADLELAKRIHSDIIRNNSNIDVFIGSSLVDMYAKCGSLQDAQRVFNKMHERNVVSWTAMIGGYVQNGHDKEALLLFEQMQSEGVKPNLVTFINILKACANLAALQQGKQIHAKLIESGFELDVFVMNTLVSMYAKCGNLEDAYELFNCFHERDVVSWTAMITGYVQQGHGEEAFTLFEEMRQQGVKPNYVTFVSILKACADLAALERGKLIHALVIQSGFQLDVCVGTALVDMYAKCGAIKDAYQVFNKIFKRDVALWNAMISGYAQQGYIKEVLSLFEQMQQAVKPNNVTFISILSACSHAGLVDEGYLHFNSMSQIHGVIPAMDHYLCIIDLLGRAGKLDAAEDLIKKMPISPNVLIWLTLLGACRSYGNMELGRRVFECLLKVQPECSAAYVLISNIYAAADRWDEVSHIRKEMEDRGLEELEYT